VYALDVHADGGTIPSAAERSVLRVGMAETRRDPDVPEQDASAAKTALDRARINYEAECARRSSNDPAERQENMRRFREARAEYFRLLGEQRR
jgi:hypothetical protein